MWDDALLFLVPFWCQIFDAFIVLRWATVAHMGLLFLQPLRGIQRKFIPILVSDYQTLWSVLGTAQRNSTNLTGSKIVTSFTKFRCFGPIWKPCHPGLWLSDTFSTSLQALNRISRSLKEALFQLPFCSSTSSTKPLICLDIFDFFSATAERNCKKLVGGRISTSLPGFVF